MLNNSIPIEIFQLISLNNSILILLQNAKAFQMNRDINKNILIIFLIIIEINRLSHAPYGASAILFNIQYLGNRELISTRFSMM